MTRDERFFYNNAGYSGGQGETAVQGRERYAKDLAAAERHARESDWIYEWELDEDGCSGCDCGSPRCPCASGAQHETWYVLLRDSEPSCYDSHGRPVRNAVLASLGGICGLTDISTSES